MTHLRYLFFILVLKVAENGALVNINTAIATKTSKDNPVLSKIIQTVDAATSDERLFEVTLKLLKSLCVCMRETLRTKRLESLQLSREMKSLQTEDDIRDADKKVLDLYQKIYNKTCFDLRQELASKVNKSRDLTPDEEKDFMDHSNCGNQKYIVENTEDYEILTSQFTQAVQGEAKLKNILLTTFVLTRDYHKFHMRKFNLYKKPQKLAQISTKHSVIVILTYYPVRNNNSSTDNSTEVISAELNTTLYSKSPIDIDIIDTRYGHKENSSEEDFILRPATNCSLKSIYSFLLQSEEINKTKVFKMLRKKGTIKVYIDIPTKSNHIDYSKACCGNATEIPLCKIDFSSESFDTQEITTYLPEFRKSKKLKDTISKIKTLVKLYDKKLNKNKLEQLNLIPTGKHSKATDKSLNYKVSSNKDKHVVPSFQSTSNGLHSGTESQILKSYITHGTIQNILLNNTSSNESWMNTVPEYKESEETKDMSFIMISTTSHNDQMKYFRLNEHNETLSTNSKMLFVNGSEEQTIKQSPYSATVPYTFTPLKGNYLITNTIEINTKYTESPFIPMRKVEIRVTTADSETEIADKNKNMKTKKIGYFKSNKTNYLKLRNYAEKDQDLSKRFSTLYDNSKNLEKLIFVPTNQPQISPFVKTLQSIEGIGQRYVHSFEVTEAMTTDPIKIDEKYEMMPKEITKVPVDVLGDILKNKIRPSKSTNFLETYFDINQNFANTEKIGVAGKALVRSQTKLNDFSELNRTKNMTADYSHTINISNKSDLKTMSISNKTFSHFVTTENLVKVTENKDDNFKLYETFYPEVSTFPPGYGIKEKDLNKITTTTGADRTKIFNKFEMTEPYNTNIISTVIDNITKAKTDIPLEFANSSKLSISNTKTVDNVQLTNTTYTYKDKKHILKRTDSKSTENPKQEKDEADSNIISEIEGKTLKKNYVTQVVSELTQAFRETGDNFSTTKMQNTTTENHYTQKTTFGTILPPVEIVTESLKGYDTTYLISKFDVMSTPKADEIKVLDSKNNNNTNTEVYSLTDAAGATIIGFVDVTNLMEVNSLNATKNNNRTLEGFKSQDTPGSFSSRQMNENQKTTKVLHKTNFKEPVVITESLNASLHLFNMKETLNLTDRNFAFNPHQVVNIFDKIIDSNTSLSDNNNPLAITYYTNAQNGDKVNETLKSHFTEISEHYKTIQPLMDNSTSSRSIKNNTQKQYDTSYSTINSVTTKNSKALEQGSENEVELGKALTFKVYNQPFINFTSAGMPATDTMENFYDATNTEKNHSTLTEKEIRFENLEKAGITNPYTKKRKPTKDTKIFNYGDNIPREEDASNASEIYLTIFTKSYSNVKNYTQNNDDTEPYLLNKNGHLDVEDGFNSDLNETATLIMTSESSDNVNATETKTDFKMKVLSNTTLQTMATNSKIEDNSQLMPPTLTKLDDNYTTILSDLTNPKSLTSVKYNEHTGLNSVTFQPNNGISPKLTLNLEKSDYFGNTENNTKENNTKAPKMTELGNKVQLLHSETSQKQPKLSQTTKYPTETPKKVYTYSLLHRQREVDIKSINDTERYSTEANKTRITRSTSAMKNLISIYNPIVTLGTTVPFNSNGVISFPHSAKQDLEQSKLLKPFQVPDIRNKFVNPTNRTKPQFKVAAEPSSNKIGMNTENIPRNNNNSSPEFWIKHSTPDLSSNIIQVTKTFGRNLNASRTQSNRLTKLEILNSTKEENSDIENLYNPVKASRQIEQKHTSKSLYLPAPSQQTIFLENESGKKNINFTVNNDLESDLDDKFKGAKKSIKTKNENYDVESESPQNTVWKEIKSLNAPKPTEKNFNFEMEPVGTENGFSYSLKPWLKETQYITIQITPEKRVSNMTKSFKSQTVQSIKSINISDTQSDSQKDVNSDTQTTITISKKSSFTTKQNNIKVAHNKIEDEPRQTDNVATQKLQSDSETKLTVSSKKSIHVNDKFDLTKENTSMNIMLSSNDRIVDSKSTVTETINSSNTQPNVVDRYFENSSYKTPTKSFLKGLIPERPYSSIYKTEPTISSCSSTPFQEKSSGDDGNYVKFRNTEKVHSGAYNSTQDKLNEIGNNLVTAGTLRSMSQKYYTTELTKPTRSTNYLQTYSQSSAEDKYGNTDSIFDSIKTSTTSNIGVAQNLVATDLLPNYIEYNTQITNKTISSGQVTSELLIDDKLRTVTKDNIETTKTLSSSSVTASNVNENKINEAADKEMHRASFNNTKLMKTRLPTEVMHKLHTNKAHNKIEITKEPTFNATRNGSITILEDTKILKAPAKIINSLNSTPDIFTNSNNLTEKPSFFATLKNLRNRTGFATLNLAVTEPLPNLNDYYAKTQSTDKATSSGEMILELERYNLLVNDRFKTITKNNAVINKIETSGDNAVGNLGENERYGAPPSTIQVTNFDKTTSLRALLPTGFMNKFDTEPKILHNIIKTTEKSSFNATETIAITKFDETEILKALEPTEVMNFNIINSTPDFFANNYKFTEKPSFFASLQHVRNRTDFALNLTVTEPQPNVSNYYAKTQSANNTILIGQVELESKIDFHVNERLKTFIENNTVVNKTNTLDDVKVGNLPKNEIQEAPSSAIHVTNFDKTTSLRTLLPTGVINKFDIEPKIHHNKINITEKPSFTETETGAITNLDETNTPNASEITFFYNNVKITENPNFFANVNRARNITKFKINNGTSDSFQLSETVSFSKDNLKPNPSILRPQDIGVTYSLEVAKPRTYLMDFHNKNQNKIKNESSDQVEFITHGLRNVKENILLNRNVTANEEIVDKFHENKIFQAFVTNSSKLKTQQGHELTKQTDEIDKRLNTVDKSIKVKQEDSFYKKRTDSIFNGLRPMEHEVFDLSTEFKIPITESLFFKRTLHELDNRNKAKTSTLKKHVSFVENKHKKLTNLFNVNKVYNFAVTQRLPKFVEYVTEAQNMSRTLSNYHYTKSIEETNNITTSHNINNSYKNEKNEVLHSTGLNEIELDEYDKVPKITIRPGFATNKSRSISKKNGTVHYNSSEYLTQPTTQLYANTKNYYNDARITTIEETFDSTNVEHLKRTLNIEKISSYGAFAVTKPLPYVAKNYTGAKNKTMTLLNNKDARSNAELKIRKNENNEINNKPVSKVKSTTKTDQKYTVTTTESTFKRKNNISSKVHEKLIMISAATLVAPKKAHLDELTDISVTTQTSDPMKTGKTISGNFIFFENTKSSSNSNRNLDAIVNEMDTRTKPSYNKESDVIGTVNLSKINIEIKPTNVTIFATASKFDELIKKDPVFDINITDKTFLETPIVNELKIFDLLSKIRSSYNNNNVLNKFNEMNHTESQITENIYSTDIIQMSDRNPYLSKGREFKVTKHSKKFKTEEVTKPTYIDHIRELSRSKNVHDTLIALESNSITLAPSTTAEKISWDVVNTKGNINMSEIRHKNTEDYFISSPMTVETFSQENTTKPFHEVTLKGTEGNLKKQIEISKVTDRTKSFNTLSMTNEKMMPVTKATVDITSSNLNTVQEALFLGKKSTGYGVTKLLEIPPFELKVSNVKFEDLPMRNDYNKTQIISKLNRKVNNSLNIESKHFKLFEYNNKTNTPKVKLYSNSSSSSLEPHFNTPQHSALRNNNIEITSQMTDYDVLNSNIHKNGLSSTVISNISKSLIETEIKTADGKQWDTINNTSNQSRYEISSSEIETKMYFKVSLPEQISTNVTSQMWTKSSLSDKDSVTDSHTFINLNNTQTSKRTPEFRDTTVINSTNENETNTDFTESKYKLVTDHFQKAKINNIYLTKSIEALIQLENVEVKHRNNVNPAFRSRKHGGTTDNLISKPNEKVSEKPKSRFSHNKTWENFMNFNNSNILRSFQSHLNKTNITTPVKSINNGNSYLKFISVKPVNGDSTIVTEASNLMHNITPNHNATSCVFLCNNTHVHDSEGDKRSSVRKTENNISLQTETTPTKLFPIVPDTIYLKKKPKKNTKKYKNKKLISNEMIESLKEITSVKIRLLDKNYIEKKSNVEKTINSLHESKDLPSVSNAYIAVSQSELSKNYNTVPINIHKKTDMLTKVNLNFLNTVASHNFNFARATKVINLSKIENANTESSKKKFDSDFKIKHVTLSSNRQVLVTSKSLLKTTKQIKYNTYRPTTEEELEPSEIEKIFSAFPRHYAKKIKTKNPQQVKNFHNDRKESIKKNNTVQDIHNKTSLFDPLNKKNVYPVKKIVNNPRRVLKRLKLPNRRNEIMTMNTKDFFSRRRAFTQKDQLGDILRLYPKPVLKLLPVTNKPRNVILRPIFNSFDTERKTPAIVEPVIMQKLDTEYYRDLYPPHHRRNGPIWKNVINQIREDFAPVSPRIGFGDPVIETPYYKPSLMKPKFLRDRVNSIRSYIYNAEQSPNYRKHFISQLDEADDTEDPLVQYSRLNSRDEEDVDTSSVHQVTRPRKTIFFLSPTVPYNHYF